MLGRSTSNQNLRNKLRQVCDEHAKKIEGDADKLLYRESERMFVFGKHAVTALQGLVQKVPAMEAPAKPKIKNWEADLHCPAAVIQPQKIEYIQDGVRWSVECEVALTVTGASHSAHCFQPNVVAIDMRAFDIVDIIPEVFDEASNRRLISVVTGAGWTTEKIVSETQKHGKLVPLGSFPSVGAQLWLQGGLGHLLRDEGLTCDSIIGAVFVSVETGAIHCFGLFPREHLPERALQSE